VNGTSVRREMLPPNVVDELVERNDGVTYYVSLVRCTGDWTSDGTVLGTYIRAMGVLVPVVLCSVGRRADRAVVATPRFIGRVGPGEMMVLRHRRGIYID
jgi:hypothetical protein